MWWTAESQYFEGTVTDQRDAQNGDQELFIEYDDGDEQWHSAKETQIVELTTEDAPGSTVSLVRPFQTRFTAAPLTPHARLHFSSLHLNV